MNTPKEQAELLRKAADTIEMCSKHGIEPLVKWKAVPCDLYKLQLIADYCYFEFPIAVIKGELIWKDTVVYDVNGNATRGDNMMEQYKPYSLKPKPLCTVEGKPVYKGDKLWFNASACARYFIVEGKCDDGRIKATDGGIICPTLCLLQPKPKTIMVEMLEEDVIFWALFNEPEDNHAVSNRLYESCRAALNKQQGE